MTNDTLLSVPLFVLHGLRDGARRRWSTRCSTACSWRSAACRHRSRSPPSSCAPSGVSPPGIVGAVVVLMGVIAMRPMLNAGYDVRLASGVDHRRRHARHPDSAFGDADRVRRRGRAVDRQALRRGDVAGLFPDVAVPDLYHRLGDHQSEDRAQITAAINTVSPCRRGCGNSNAAATRQVIGGLLAAALRPSLAQGATLPDERQAGLQRHRQEPARGGGAGGADRRHVRRNLVVHRHLQRTNRQPPSPQSSGRRRLRQHRRLPHRRLSRTRRKSLGHGAVRSAEQRGPTRRRSAARGDDDSAGSRRPSQRPAKCPEHFYRGSGDWLRYRSDCSQSTTAAWTASSSGSSRSSAPRLCRWACSQSWCSRSSCSASAPPPNRRQWGLSARCTWRSW